LEELRIVIESGFEEAGIAIDWQVEEHLPPVWASRQELLQAFLNITKNAQRAMEDSPAKKLLVQATVEDGAVVVRFIDSGPGVAEPERLFKPFQPGAEANGLGLYLSRAFVRSFRGDIHYQPQPAGACFTVSLVTVAEPKGRARELEEENGNHSSVAGRRPQPVSRES